MYSSSKVKAILSASKEGPYRNLQSSLTPKTALEGFTYNKDFRRQASPSNHETQASSSHYIHKGAKTSSGYRSKGSLEVSDNIENSKLLGFTSYASAAYDNNAMSHYDLQNSHDFLENEGPPPSTRAAFNKGKTIDNYGDMNTVSYRGMISPQKNNDVCFMAEKVYSMKIKSAGIMGSLIPLNKTKSPNNTHLGTKIVTPGNNHSGFKEIDENLYSDTPSLKSGENSQFDYAGEKNTGLVKGKYGASSQKSFAKVSNEAKSATYIPNKKQLKRDNSVGRMNKSPLKPFQNDKRSPTRQAKGKNGQTTSYQMICEQQQKEKPKLTYYQRIEMIGNKLSTIAWQVNQRNKRSVFVKLLDIYHYYQDKLNQHYERKAEALKSKSFYIWRQYLLEAILEQQRLQQEKVQEMKGMLAAEFFDRKLTTKYFKIMRNYRDPYRRTLKQTQGLHSKSVNSLKQVTSPQKPSITQTKVSTPTKNRASTPSKQGKVTPGKEKSHEKRESIPNARPMTPKENVNQSRSKSASKNSRPSANSPMSKQRSNAAQAKVEANKSVNKSSIQVSRSKENSPDLPCFGKTPKHFYEPSEIQEITEISQSPQKTDRKTKNELNQSFGIGNLEHLAGREKPAFDSILAAILKSPRDKTASSPAIKSSNREDLDLKQTKNEEPKVTSGTPGKRRSNIMPTFSLPLTARDYSNSGNIEKDSCKNKSLSARSKPEEVEIDRRLPQEVVFKSRTPNKNTLEAKQESFENDDCDDEMDVDNEKYKKAEAHRRRVLLQTPFVWLLAASMQTKEEMAPKIELADIHYNNTLKIKAVSALLKHFVQSFNESQLYKERYEKNLLKSCLNKWAGLVPDLRNQNLESEIAYHEVVSRFRFIVLAEKSLRQWKELVKTNKRNSTQKKKK